VRRHSRILFPRVFFTIIHTSRVTDELAEKIQQRMEEIRDEDAPITEEWLNREQAMTFLQEIESRDRLGLFESAKELDGGWLNRLNDKAELFYVHLLPSAGHLRLFEVRRYRNGMLLRFPHMSDPSCVPPYAEQRQLYEAFSEETIWERLLGVHYAKDLNEKITCDDYKDLIMVSEALHEKKIAEIAGMIRERKKRIILIAGPSSSGKTTFAKRLCIQLRVLGLKPLYLGTDDYFKEREDCPFDENGKRDFENLVAMDLDLFETQMNDLLAGKTVDIPTFDFKSGKKVYGTRITSIDDSRPIVIEGIHGLNPLMTEGISEDVKFRIYISPLTSLNIDIHHRMPTTDARMLRRMVRDNRTRNRKPQDTIRDWPSVRAGEEKNIFPYNSEADVFFNSQCAYELAALKTYAEPLLEQVQPEEEEYPEAQRMLMFLKFFEAMPDDSAVLNNSILREFIGGSIIMNE